MSVIVVTVIQKQLIQLLQGQEELGKMETVTVSSGKVVFLLPLTPVEVLLHLGFSQGRIHTPEPLLGLSVPGLFTSPAGSL